MVTKYFTTAAFTKNNAREEFCGFYYRKTALDVLITAKYVRKI